MEDPKTTPEQPTGQVQASTADLTAAIDTLHTSFGILQKRLIPILRPDQPRDKQASALARAEGTCELADTIIDQSMRLRLLIDDMDIVTERIEL
jgi:hypothetical protein